jgi:type IV pilus assembly protein PilY1
VTRTAVQCAADQKIIFNGAFPFTASPDVARDPSGNIWLYAGSGKYVSDVDEGDIADNIFLGIKTNLVAGTPVQIGVTPTTDFIDRTNVITTGTVTSTRFECLYNAAGSGSTQFTLQEVVTGIALTSAPVAAPPIGWYLTLIDGERVISRPLAVGGLVDFLTYKPNSDICSYGGSSYLYAVDYLSGVAPTNVAIRTPGTAKDTATGDASTTGNVTISKGILLGPGAPPTGEAITIPPPKEGQEQLKKKIQIATGVIVEAENTPMISTISKVVHWLKK